MNLEKVGPGLRVPEEINVIIEIPAHGDPVKYEVDKETGAMFVDRFLPTAMHYPCNYGYVPGTLSEDGDPVDVLVITPIAVITGAVIKCRPIGMLCMTDESGKDSKILAVPVDKLSPFYHEIKSPEQVSKPLLAAIVPFFEHYKDLEPGKWVKVDKWVEADKAKEEILASIDRYQKDSN